VVDVTSIDAIEQQGQLACGLPVPVAQSQARCWFETAACSQRNSMSGYCGR
jgi:hypothetical protein